MSNFNRYQYKTAEAFFKSDSWRQLSADEPKIKKRIFSSTRLEDMIYNDLRRSVDIGLDEIETQGKEKIETFPELIWDVFQSIYSIYPKKNNPEELCADSRAFNLEVMNHIRSDDRYGAIKHLCEGRAIPAYEAITGFTEQIMSKLEDLLKTADGGKGFLNALNNMEKQKDSLINRLKNMAKQHENCLLNDAGEKKLLALAAKTESVQQQIERLSKMIQNNFTRSNDEIMQIVDSALDTAIEKAEQAASVISSWGTEGSDPQSYKLNAELLSKARNNSKVKDMLKYLGKYREIMNNARKNSYAYGRGDKYDICLGNDYSRAISSEFAYLALKETTPLFIHKVLTKSLKQYRKREKVSKGYGDSIIIIDESASMTGDPIAWAKALALTLMECTLKNGRKCALIRFSGFGQIEAHIFNSCNYSFDDIISYVDSFFNGGTEFTGPLDETVELIEKEGFRNADAIFLSDGDCYVNKEYLENYKKRMLELNFTITTVLLGLQETSSSLLPISKKVYLLKDIKRESLALELIANAA